MRKILTSFQERGSVLHNISNEAFFFLNTYDLDDLIIYVDYEGERHSCMCYTFSRHARKYNVSRSTIRRKIDRGRYVAATTFVRLMIKNPNINIPDFLHRTFSISNVTGRYIFEDVKSTYDIYPERIPEGLLRKWD